MIISVGEVYQVNRNLSFRKSTDIIGVPPRGTRTNKKINFDLTPQTGSNVGFFSRQMFSGIAKNVM